MDNSQRLNELFSQAKKQKPKTSFEQTKSAFKINLKSGSVKSSFLTQLKSFKTILIMTLSTIIMGVGLIYFSSIDNKTTPESANKNNKKIAIENPILIEKVTPKIAKIEVQKIIEKQLIDLKRKGIIVAEVVENKSPLTINEQEIRDEKVYKFPELTKQQIEDNQKQKKKMLKELSKFDKKKYAFIPSGTTTIKGEQISIQAFYMQTTEVSVLEYRTFLFDLLIQNRKDEFLIAKPDQSQWMKYGWDLSKMELNYFSHPAYNEYPINNISKLGIDLYCRWLNEEQTKAYGKIINDVRLPYNEEWMYAAKGGEEKTPYPWGGPYLRNSKGCFLANYKPGGIDCGDCLDSWNKFKGLNEKDSLNNYIKTADDVVIPKESKNLYSADGGFYTVKVNSYNPNGYGLYCMSGNIAEMVLNNNNEVIAKGGGWNSIGQQLQIEEDNNFEQASEPNPEIGFRVVVTYLDENKQSYIPFGTKKIGENLYMDETEISNLSWKEYLKWLEDKYGKESTEYSIAFPDTNVWSTYLKYKAPYDQHYFSHPAYNDYPVVGISYNQAIAFCKWRTDRVKEYYKVNPSKSFPINFEYRLPTEEEWERAAKIGYSDKTLKEIESKHQNEPKTNHKLDREDVSINTGDVTAPVKSYWPNSFGIYNLEGNVAEMMQEKGISKGGSWIHTEEESNIKNDISYSKQECWLGFRCVFEVLD